MDKDAILKDDFTNYKYYRYIWGDGMPDVGIRIAIDKQGNDTSAETVDLETGEIEKNHLLRMAIKKSFHLERTAEGARGLRLEAITEAEFKRLNAARMEWAAQEKRAGRWENPPYISVRDYVSLHPKYYQNPTVVLWRFFCEGLPRDETTVSLCSDSLCVSSEAWTMVVDAEHVPKIEDTLRRDLRHPFDGKAENLLEFVPRNFTRSDRAGLLELFARKYTRPDSADIRDNPYSEISELLRKEGIPVSLWYD